jgi:hypothetical protein
MVSPGSNVIDWTPAAALARASASRNDRPVPPGLSTVALASLSSSAVVTW